MTKLLSTLATITLLSLVSTNLLAQGGVGINGTAAKADSSAMIDVSSTSKGMLAPRMTSAQRAAISRPATGLLVYQTDGTAGFYYNGGGKNSPNWIQLSTSQVTQLQDADNDTKIQVEANTDEDIIRFDMAGTEFFRMQGGRLEVLNNGNSVFMGHGAGFKDDLSTNYNVFVGYAAGMLNTTGSNNTAIGSFALDANTTGFQNTAVGRGAFTNSTTGPFNTGLGMNAGFGNTTGAFNTAIGAGSLEGNSTGHYNTSIGHYASRWTTGSENTVVGSEANNYNTTGIQNTIIGKQAGRGTVNHSKSGNVFIGYQAGYNETTSNKLYIENSNSASPLIYGDFANDLVKIYGTLNVNDAFSFPITDGTSNQVLKTNGSGVLSWTTITSSAVQDLSLNGNTLSLSGSSATVNLSSLADNDNDTKIQVEENADDDIIRFDMAGTEFFKMDGGRLEVLNTGNSVFMGTRAGLNDDLTVNNNVFVGYEAGMSNTTGSSNIAIGSFALDANTSGLQNTAVGRAAFGKSTTGSFNVGLGNNAGLNNTYGASNTAIGTESLQGNSTGNYNTSIGYFASILTTGSDNTVVGSEANRFNTAGTQNTIIGTEAGRGTVNHSKSGNVFIGYQAGHNDTTDNKLYIENSSSATPLIYGDFANDLVKIHGTLNVNDAFTFPTTDGTSNQVLKTNGSGVLSWTTKTGNVDQDLSLSGNTLSLSGSNATVSLSGLAVKSLSDNDTDTKIQVEESTDEDMIRFDIAGTERWKMIGPRLENSNTGNSVFIGYQSGLNDDLTNNAHVFIGHRAGASTTSGDQNIAIGANALANNTTGNFNTNIGSNTGLNNTTGGSNTIIGTAADLNNTSGSYNTFIGFSAGRGTVAHSKSGNVFIGYSAGYNDTTNNKLYIENSSSTSPLIWGDFANDLVNVNGKLGIGTSSPSCPLEISGSANTSTSYGYLNSSGSTGTGSASKSYSIKASHNIMAAEFNAVSDRRIKTNREPSSGKNDLDIVNQIQVTNYTHIDTVAKGNEVKKGFIAQQVESVFPQAVHQSTNFIPSIYSLSAQVQTNEAATQMTISVTDSHQLAVGDRIRLITAKGQLELEVLATPSATQFTIETVKDLDEQIFVYGKEVHDFRAVDYDRVFTAGIGAIQELSKQNTELKSETLELKDRLNKLEALVSNLVPADEVAQK